MDVRIPFGGLAPIVVKHSAAVMSLHEGDGEIETDRERDGARERERERARERERERDRERERETKQSKETYGKRRTDGWTDGQAETTKCMYQCRKKDNTTCVGVCMYLCTYVCMCVQCTCVYIYT